MAALRRIGRIAALAAALMLCLPLHLLWRLLRLRSPWPRCFLALGLRAVGARVRIEGHRQAGDLFLIANHVSWMDILALGGATGAAFVAKDDVAAWPVIGWLARQNNTLFVSRDRRAGVSAQIDALRTAIAGHQPVAIFPEGTTGDGTQLLPFKPALLSVLLPPPREVTIQPVHIDYGAEAAAIAWHGEEPAGANMKRLLSLKGRRLVTLRFLEPIDPATCTDRKAIAALAHQRIATSMAQRQQPFARATRSV